MGMCTLKNICHTYEFCFFPPPPGLRALIFAFFLHSYLVVPVLLLLSKIHSAGLVHNNYDPEHEAGEVDYY